MKRVLWEISLLVTVSGCAAGQEGGQTVAARPASFQPPSEAPSGLAADPADVWLAFEAWGREASTLYVVRADGSSLHELPTGTGGAAAPAFSPNGKALAFVGGNAHLLASTGIDVMDLRDGSVRALTDRPSDRSPAWSPDGRLLAFTRDTDIHVVNADGTNDHVVVKGPVPGGAWSSGYDHAAFTPDAASLVVASDAALEIADIGAAATGTRVLFAPLGGSPRAALSPDATSLAVIALCLNHGETDSVLIVPIAKAARACNAGVYVPSNARLAEGPAWGRNGLIAFAEGTAPGQVWVVAEKGGAPRRVLDDDAKALLAGSAIGNVAWSPPGALVPP